MLHVIALGTQDMGESIAGYHLRQSFMDIELRSCRSWLVRLSCAAGGQQNQQGRNGGECPLPAGFQSDEAIRCRLYVFRKE
jgi:hypothetical protein